MLKKYIEKIRDRVREYSRHAALIEEELNRERAFRRPFLEQQQFISANHTDEIYENYKKFKRFLNDNGISYMRGSFLCEAANTDLWAIPALIHYQAAQNYFGWETRISWINMRKEEIVTKTYEAPVKDEVMFRVQCYTRYNKLENPSNSPNAIKVYGVLDRVEETTPTLLGPITTYRDI